MAIDSTIAQRMPKPWLRVAAAALAFLTTAAIAIALAVAALAWLAKIDAVTYIPANSIAVPVTEKERAP